jgi:hypothetical protein
VAQCLTESTVLFKRYRFTFSTTADKALASLDKAVAACPGFGLAIDANGRIKVFRSQGVALLNGFFPVFVGRFKATGANAELHGGFRFHLLAIGLFAGFIATSVFSLINLLYAPDLAANLPEGWKSQRVRFELQFIVFAALSAGFAWLAGKPMRERITAIIKSSTIDRSADRSERN